MAETVRAVAVYSGWVQGVGFRFTARRTAAGFAVAGCVRNLADGDVELIAEGTEKEVLAFLAALKRAMDRYIDRVQLRWEPATGEFSSFFIRP